MEPRILKIVLVTTVILAVIALSVFPKDHGTGSYQSVNGPTTTFAGLRAALLLVWILCAAATAIVTRRLVVAENIQATDHSSLSCAMLC